MDETECYNFLMRKWTTEDDIPTTRAGSAYGVVRNGALMVAGGEGFGNAFDAVDVYDGKNWTEMGKLKTARHGTGLAAHSCACGGVTIASGSGRHGGRPDSGENETFLEKGMKAKCR